MKKEIFKSGFVAIIGRPNVGKSTLLNAFLDSKISIVSKVPQTTRHLLRGILNLRNAQIVFVDSPGIHMFRDKLAKHLNVIAKKSIVDTELILYVVDTSRYPGQEEERIIDFLLQQKVKIIMALNKIDLDKKFAGDYVSLWSKKIEERGAKYDPLCYCVPVSAKTGKNLKKLKQAIKKELPVQFPLYGREDLTDFPLKFRISDIIREKLFIKLKEELPHSLAVEVLEMEERDRLTYINVVIYAKRNSQKKIIIGKGGEFIKKIGSLARYELEKIIKRKIYLEIWVKVVPNWPEKIRILKELGYGWE